MNSFPHFLVPQETYLNHKRKHWECLFSRPEIIKQPKFCQWGSKENIRKKWVNQHILKYCEVMGKNFVHSFSISRIVGTDGKKRFLVTYPVVKYMTKIVRMNSALISGMLHWVRSKLPINTPPEVFYEKNCS